MERIAFISGNTFLYWNSLILALAGATAVCFFLWAYLGRDGKALAGFAVLPLALILSVVLSRFVHWYSRSDSYSGFLSAMTDYSSGGYALIGAFAGCALAAAILRLVKLHDNLSKMLDAMAVGGSAGIAVGRLASFFTTTCRGGIVEGITFLPIVYPVTNAVSGVTEYRLATFLFQSIVALAIFVGLAVFMLRSRKIKDGDICLIFLLIYGASQVMLDSTRYDSLFFRSNGFVSIVQVFSALALGLAMVVFSVRMVKAKGFRFRFVPLWLLWAVFVGGAGFMEYYVQRHGDRALFAYSVMTVFLAGIVELTMTVRKEAVKAEQKK